MNINRHKLVSLGEHRPMNIKDFSTHLSGMKFNTVYPTALFQVVSTAKEQMKTYDPTSVDTKAMEKEYRALVEFTRHQVFNALTNHFTQLASAEGIDMTKKENQQQIINLAEEGWQEHNLYFSGQVNQKLLMHFGALNPTLVRHLLG